MNAPTVEKKYTHQKTLFSTSAIALSIALLFLINIFSQYALSGFRIDLTANKLYTLSIGTKNILKQIEEPITLQYYYSKKLSAGLASMNSYATQVKELLDEYVRLSHGKITLKLIDPEAFSEQEDVAIGYGLQGVPVDESGSAFYFGLVGTNSTDVIKQIPFFQTGRETYLEYDITQMLYQLMHPEKPTIGIISSLPIQNSQTPWAITEQLNQFYETQEIQPNATEISEKIKVLVLANPEGLTDSSLYAIDQFILRGGHLLGFLDTFSETSPQSHAVKNEDIIQINKLLTNWGITLTPNKVVADKKTGKQVWFNKDSHQTLVEYPFWLDIEKNRINQTDLVTADLDLLTLSTPGYFTLNKEKVVGLEIDTLFSSTQEATEFDATTITNYQSNPEQVMRDYQANNKIYHFAVRLSGTAKSAFPNGNPSPTPNTMKQSHLSVSRDKISIILISDSDLLHDRFWLRSQNFLGQQVTVPVASNGSFFLNALDNLSGSSDLISVRSRGEFSRPFSKLRSIQQKAEATYQKTETELLNQLKETDNRLKTLNDQKIEGNKLILSAAQQTEIENFRQEQIHIRKQLRAVQHELQRDIENITSRIKFINIGMMPLLVGFVGIALGFCRKRKRDQSILSIDTAS